MSSEMRNSGSPLNKDDKSNTLQLFLPAIITTVFGAHAMDLGKFIARIHMHYIKGTPFENIPEKNQFIVQDGLISLAIGFIIVLIWQAREAASINDQKTHQALTMSIFGGLLGGLFSIFKETTGPSVALTYETAKGVLYLFIMVCLFLIPSWVLTSVKSPKGCIAIVVYRTGVAALLAGVGALIAHIIPQLCWVFGCANGHEGHFTQQGAPFFISSPFTAMIFAPWALLIALPYVQDKKRKVLTQKASFRWSFSYSIAAILVSICYALFLYYFEHYVQANGWLRRGGISQTMTVFYFFLLQMPSVFGSAVASILLYPKIGDPLIKKSDSLTLVAVFAAGVIAAFVVSVQIMPREGMNNMRAFIFILAHGMTALATALAVLISFRLRMRGKSPELATID